MSARACVLVCLVTGMLQAEDWKLDVVHRKQGREPFHGLILSDGPGEIEMLRVFRKAGSPTVVMKDRVPRNEVAQLEKLGDADREILKTRLETLSKERKVLSAQIQLWKGGKVELPPSEMLELKPTQWGPERKSKALAYESTSFRLESNAREDIVLLTAIQLEQLFTAYSRFLPSRSGAGKPTILLTQSVEEYNALVKIRGHNILNPAFFDPRDKQVVCGSDLERLTQDLGRIHTQHVALLKDLDARRKELQRIYSKQVPPELLGPIDEATRKINALEKKNSDVVKICHLRLVRCLCHEAFHAYLNASMFADRRTPVPAWLDEGLAQVFETALVEGGELQLGFPDPDRLKRVRAALESKEILSLVDLLRSTPRQFQVAHTQEKQISDRHYLAAWALGFYLTFEKRVLSSDALDEYLIALDRGTDGLDAFCKLIGEPLSQAEKRWHEYLQTLRPDGTIPPKK